MLQHTSGSTGGGTPPPMDSAEAIYLSHLGFIEAVAAHLARRNHMSAEDAEDFASLLKTKLWENDYERIRKFKGESSIRTYLQTVGANLFKDFRNQRWGKWRPCAEAIRLGKVAVKLDELTSRDDYGFEEACEILRTNFRVGHSREELLAIWTRLPPRSTRQMEGEAALQARPADTERPEGRILEGELAKTRSRVAAALTRAYESLSSDDRLLVEMSILRDWKVSEVARVLHLDQRRLYRRIEGICKELKKRLAAEGLGWEQVKDLLNRKDLRW